MVKTMSERGWYLNQPRLGAPFGQNRARTRHESPRGHFDDADPGKHIVHGDIPLAQTLPITSSPNPASVSGGAKSQNQA